MDVFYSHLFSLAGGRSNIFISRQIEHLDFTFVTFLYLIIAELLSTGKWLVSPFNIKILN